MPFNILRSIMLYAVTFVLFGCQAKQKTISQNQMKIVTLTATDPTSVGAKKTSILFNKLQPFKIDSFVNTINNNTTDTNTLKCSTWKLDKNDIERIIQNSEHIDGTTWDLTFSQLSCSKTVFVSQNEHKFKIEINAGSYLSINNGDTTILFGNFKNSDRKYFLEEPDRR